MRFETFEELASSIRETLSHSAEKKRLLVVGDRYICWATLSRNCTANIRLLPNTIEIRNSFLAVVNYYILANQDKHPQESALMEAVVDAVDSFMKENVKGIHMSLERIIKIMVESVDE